MQIMTIEETALFLKRTPAAIRSLISRGQIPHRRAGGRRVVFIQAEIEAWLQDAPGLSLEKMKRSAAR